MKWLKKVALRERQQNSNQKVDPRAKKFLDLISNLLEKNGIADKKQRDQCSFDLFEITKKCLKEYRHITNPNNDMETLLEMAGVLKKFGITEEVVQEDIILEYFKTLKDLGTEG